MMTSDPAPARPILIAEDDPDDQHLMLEALASAGVTHPIETVGNGKLAIERLKRAPTPCLVLLDIKMPLADGFEALRWIRKSKACAAVPVLMLSGSLLPGDMAKAAACGANAFLVKPASHDTLVAMMRAIKDFWLTFHRLPAALS